MTLPTWWAKVDNGRVVDLIIVDGTIDGAAFVATLDGTWVQSPESGPWAQNGGCYNETTGEFYPFVEV